MEEWKGGEGAGERGGTGSEACWKEDEVEMKADRKQL